MLEKQIADFVKDIIATGCDICAIGTTGYLIGDADLEEAHCASSMILSASTISTASATISNSRSSPICAASDASSNWTRSIRCQAVSNRPANSRSAK